ncbi:MAG: ABC transporter permease subunit [Alphaproteobacteria bacterium]|nr:ABC transporter permease subunit [Alphaproteobacteria bacterium]
MSALPLAGAALVIVLWHGAIAAFKLPPFILPSLPSILARMAADADLLVAAIGVTLFEAVAGYLAGAALGIALAVQVVLMPRLEGALVPPLVAVNSVPTVAYAPLALLWFGIGPLSKIVVVAVVVSFTLLLNTLHGLKRADPAAIALLRSFGAGRWRVMTTLRFPGALPAIANGLRVAVVRSMIIAIVTEMLGAYRGIGWMIYEGTQQMDFLRVWAAVGVGSLASMAFYGLVSWLDRRFVWWR